MRTLELGLVVTASLASSGCFQASTLITIKGNGSGTIDQTMLMTGQALAQLRTFAALGSKDGKPFELFNEAQARQQASAMGPGVTFVSATPIHSPDGEGQRYVLAFEDINQLHIDQQPAPPNGIRAGPADASPDQQIRFAFTTQPDGTAVLRVLFPPFKMPDTSAVGIPAASQNKPSPEQLATIRQMFDGARMTVAIEPVGTVTRTTSPYVDGQKVTLLDLDFSQLFKDESVIARLNQAKSPDEVKAAIKDLSGLKVNVDREITIEFKPAR